MSVLIIYAHPNPKSYTHAVLESLIRGLESAKTPYEVIDLYAIGFNPVLVVDETRRRRDLIHDAETQGFRDAIARADHVVHVYPLWWDGFPAILKGFIDRVYASGFAYSFQGKTPGAILPHRLLKGKAASFFYTLDGPHPLAWFILSWFGAKFSIFWYCGFGPIRRHFFTSVKRSSPERRARWLKRVEALAKGL